MKLPFEITRAPGWLTKTGPAKDVVISSRIRLARNLRNYPFPDQADEENLKQLREQLSQDLAEDDQFDLAGYELERLPERQQKLFVERRLMSDELPNRPASAIFLHPDQSHGMMVNEEDHLRIQAMSPGYNLEDPLERARSIEQRLARSMEFARAERWGYLTSCPTNLGTGLRGSVLVQLPGLVLKDEIDQIFKAVSNLGLTVRGFYGEGSETQGFYFQISNQVTLGRSIEELLDSLQRVTEQIIERERKARQTLLNSDQEAKILDRIWRAVGIVTHARQISSREALQMLSLTRLGIVTEEIEEIDRKQVDRMLVLMQPAHLEERLGESLKASNRDQFRAQRLRKAFQEQQQPVNPDE